jgi:lactoylglutathione lyase
VERNRQEPAGVGPVFSRIHTKGVDPARETSRLHIAGGVSEPPHEALTMAKAIHSMIRVLDEARSVRFYEAAFGLEVADRFPFADFTILYLRNPESDFELELTVNHGRTEPYAPGDGYGHLAFAVDDLDAERRRFEGLGLAPTPVKRLDRDGRPLAAFFFVADPDGYKIEVLQRQGRYR